MTVGTVGADGRELVSRSSVVAAGTLLSRLTGLARVAITLAVLGGGLLGDTYNAANNTPNIVYELLLGGVLTATLVPIFVDLREGGRPDGDRGVAAVFTTALTALLALTVLAFIGAPLIADLFARRASHDVAVTFVRFFLPQIFFYGFVALAGAELNARRRFVAAAFAPVVNNVVVIAVLAYVAWHWGALDGLGVVRDDRSLLVTIALGTTVGIVAMAAALIPSLARTGMNWRPVFAPRDPAVGHMLRLSGWTLGYAAANQVALLAVLHIASRTEGAWVAYASAFIFFQLPYGLFAVTIMTALGPELASAWQAADRARFHRDFARGMRFLLLLIVPSAIGMFTLALPIVALLRRGSFGSQGVANTGAALAAFAVGLVPFCVYLYALRAFYAMSDTRTPFVVNCSENVLNVALAIPLNAAYGVRGLALSFSIAYLVAAGGALLLLRGRAGPFPSGGVTGAAVRATAAGALAGFTAYLIAGRFGASAGLYRLLLATAVAGIVYVGALAVLGSSDLRALGDLARGALRRGRRQRV